MLVTFCLLLEGFCICSHAFSQQRSVNGIFRLLSKHEARRALMRSYQGATFGSIGQTNTTKTVQSSQWLTELFRFAPLIVVMAVTWLPLQIKWVHKRKEMLRVWKQGNHPCEPVNYSCSFLFLGGFVFVGLGVFWLVYFFFFSRCSAVDAPSYTHTHPMLVLPLQLQDDGISIGVFHNCP